MNLSFIPVGRLPLPGLALAVWLVSGRSLCFLVPTVLRLFWEQKGLVSADVNPTPF